VIRGKEHVRVTKPDPAIYLAALAALQVSGGQAIAFEDSPNGIQAAKAAGLFCIAVPNEMTSGLPLDRADLHMRSLADMRLGELLKKVEEMRRSSETR
jgi:putative hydrolase of the HAD superfamily